MKRNHILTVALSVVVIAALAASCMIFSGRLGLFSTVVHYDQALTKAILPPPKPQLDKTLYDELMEEMANNPAPATSTATTTMAAASSTAALASSTAPKKPAYLWPVKNLPYPEYGAIFPFSRVVAYYGNFLSTGMGILGQYPSQEVLTRLVDQVAQWRAADPSTPVIPAIDYIAITAQGSPGYDGMYRLRMPASEIQKAVDMAEKVNGVVILDIQVGWSTVQKELPYLEQYLKLPNVELALDPEFALQSGKRPGTYIGTMDAADINYAAGFLARIVQENGLPPKFLVVHRFTEAMVTDYRDILPLPQVQIVIDMDGFGTKAQKKKVYDQVVYSEPVQFAGLKLFYKNDVQSGGMMTPLEALSLRPKPVFIQYQ